MVGAYRAAGDFVCFAVVVLVVWRLSVTGHGHDIREHGSGSVILVGVEEDTEAFEPVRGAKDIARSGALLCEPHSEAVTEQAALSMNLKLHQNLVA